MNEMIEDIINNLEYFGYQIDTVSPQMNQGVSLTRITFKSNTLILIVYDKRRKGNTVIGGKGDDFDKGIMKEIVEKTKWDNFTNKELEKTILSFILTKKESELYDFKEQWSKSNSDLLHDILCLANNSKNQKAYLIIGVTDEFFVKGLDGYRDQDEIHDWFRKMKFACGQSPKIDIHKLCILDKKLDVLEVSPDTNVPYYLDQDYASNGNTVKKYHIYTRNGDSNTPKTEQANKNDIQKLWSFRIV